MALNRTLQDELIEGIHNGTISVFNLPDLLFEYTFEELIKMVDEGFEPEKLKKPKQNIYAGFRTNINEFSADKTISEVKRLTLAVFDENGNKRKFPEFKKIALEIDNTYNITHLKTEQDSAFGQAQSADQWVRTEQKQDLFPYLEYRTSGDDAVRQQHAAWNGIIKKVNDPFWETRYPVNGWNCRCRVIRLTKEQGQGKETNLSEHLDKVNKKFKSKDLKELNSLKNTDKVFANHSAKTRLIFNTKKTDYYKDVQSLGLKRGNNNYGFGEL